MNKCLVVFFKHNVKFSLFCFSNELGVLDEAFESNSFFKSILSLFYEKVMTKGIFLAAILNFCITNKVFHY